MKLETAAISSHQLVYLVFAFLMGSSVILFPGGGAENNAWLAVILGTVEGFIFLSIYNWLAGQHPGKNLVEINDLVFGPYLGKAISSLYLLFFLYVTAQILRTFAAFFAFIMSATPLPVFIITLLLISASAVRNGIEVIARLSQIAVIVSLFSFFLDYILLFKDLKISNFLPFMDIPIKDFLLSAQSVAALPFGEAVVFLMIMAFIPKTDEAGSAMKKAFLWGGLMLMLHATRAVAVHGSLASVFTYPAFSTVRYINIADVFTRVEIIVAIVFLMLGFVKASVFYYATALGMAQICRTNSYRPLVLPIGALIFIVSILVYPEYIYDIIDGSMLFPFYSMIFALLLPLITLIVASIRKTGYKQEVNHAA